MSGSEHPVPARRGAVAIVDFHVGNLFSVARACAHVGLEPRITSDPRDVVTADGVVLPGVGAFGDAMANLERLGLRGPLQEVAEGSTPLLGICLGMQLLARESHEFGHHEGLGIVEGVVRKLPTVHDGRPTKVPLVGWSTIHRPLSTNSHDVWGRTVLEGIRDGAYAYFVHSYYVDASSEQDVLALTTYGGITYPAAVRWQNAYGLQFHPERSGPSGLEIYENFASIVAAEGE